MRPNLSSTFGICTGLSPGLMCAGLAGIFGFSAMAGLEVSVFCDTLEGGLGADDSGDNDVDDEADEMLVSSSSPRVSVPVIVTSDSDIKLDSYDLAPCN